jgi:uncharacterized membrane protein YfcA
MTGAILGLGGGMIVTPILTLLVGLDIKYALGASIVCVIGTSAGTSIAYLRDNILNIRLAMFLEIFTTIGGLSGALLVTSLKSDYMYFLFTILYVYMAINMIVKIRYGNKDHSVHENTGMTTLADKLRLNGSYYDKLSKKEISYRLHRVQGGAAVMFGAGFASGLMGIGSGGFKVLAMDTVMGMPLKASTATSNFMMGVTAVASASIYFFAGYINPIVVGPIAVGVIIGATLGSRIMQRLHNVHIRLFFIIVMIFLAVQMFYKGWSGV